MTVVYRTREVRQMRTGFPVNQIPCRQLRRLLRYKPIRESRVSQPRVHTSTVNGRPREKAPAKTGERCSRSPRY